MAFGVIPSAEAIERSKAGFEIDRSLAVFDGGMLVGTAGAISTELTLPGLTTLPVAAVAFVSVSPTHRRRGFLRRMMSRQLEDIRDRGESLAILHASESSIYGRFGYGMATENVSLAIQTAHAQFARAVEYPGAVRLADHEEARSILPKVFDAARLQQPGAIRHLEAWWEAQFDLPEAERTGAKSRFFAVARSSTGEAEAYATYGVKLDWHGSVPDNSIDVRRVIASNDLARAALWDFLLRLDLAGAVRLECAPADEPLRWWLADSRRLRQEHRWDGLWVRIVDVCTALSSRAYAVPGALVLEVQDSFRPQSSGRFYLEGSPDGASCRPTTRRPDLVMRVEDLGSIYLGGHLASTLARAGRIREETQGALHRANAMFMCDRLPWCPTTF